MLQTIRNHHTTSKFFTEFAERAELVYFGDVSRDGQDTFYKGVTFAPGSKDAHYIHGTKNEYDVSVFSRKSSHATASRSAIESDWTVMAVHLKMGGFPHLILDTLKHDRAFYATVFTRFPSPTTCRRSTAHYKRIGSNTFDLYLKPEANMTATQLFDDTVLQKIFSTYAQYDVELEGQHTVYFSPWHPQSAKSLNDMLNEALWIAETIENRAHTMSPVPTLQTA